MPSYDDLQGIEADEAAELLDLRTFCHDAVARRQAEWGRYLASPEALADEARHPFDAARAGLAAYEEAVVKANSALATAWADHYRKAAPWTAWRRFLQFHNAADFTMLAARVPILPSGARAPVGGGPPSRGFEVVTRPFVAWPYVLAERLDLGKVEFTYDAMGFDSDKSVSQAAPKVTPRIRVRGVFRAQAPEPSFPVADLRFHGDEIAALDAAYLPKGWKPSGWEVGDADPFPKGTRRVTRFSPEKPAEKDPKKIEAAKAAAKEKNEKLIGPQWLEKLTADNQQNPTAQDLLFSYWKGRLPGRWLARVERLDLRRRGSAPTVYGGLAGGTASGAAVPDLFDPADWEATVGDTAAARELILRRMLGDLKGALESSLASLTAAGREDLREARAGLDAVRDLVRREGGDPAIIPTPEDILFASAQLVFDGWGRHLASMLPDLPPGTPLYRHPWPDRFPPELVARPAEVRAAVRPVRRQVDRLLLTRVGGGNPGLTRLLTDLADRLEPSDVDFRAPDFASADRLRKTYAEVNRLLLVAGRCAVKAYLRKALEEYVRGSGGAALLRKYGVGQLLYALQETLDADRSTQVALWTWKAARRGVPHAQFLLGERYEAGRGVATDAAAAFEMYAAAAKSGHTLALTKLADCYRTGFGTPVADDKVVPTYEQAVANGDVGAMVALGDVYAYGSAGRPVDRARVRSGTRGRPRQAMTRRSRRGRPSNRASRKARSPC